MNRVEALRWRTFVTLLLALLLPCAAQAQNNATVTLTFDPPTYSPTPLNATVQIPCHAVSTANGAQECGGLTDNWSWTLVEVTSAPSEGGNYQPTSNYVSGGFIPATSASPNLSISFTQPGWYQVYVQVTDNYLYGCGNGTATSGPQAAPLVNAVAVQIKMNGTTDPNAFIALIPVTGSYTGPGPNGQVGTQSSQAAAVTQCTAQVLGNPTQTMTLTLTPGQGLSVAPTTLTVGAAPVQFTASGLGGASPGPTTLGYSLALPAPSTETVTGSDAVTLFTFQGTISNDAGGEEPVYSLNTATGAFMGGGGFVNIYGSVRTTPVVDCAYPPANSYQAGIVQTASNTSITWTYGSPTVTDWAGEPNDVTVSVPSTITASAGYSGSGDDFVPPPDGPGWGPWCTATIDACPGGQVKNQDAPGITLVAVITLTYPDSNQKLVTVKYTLQSATYTGGFDDFMALNSDGIVAGVVPLPGAECSWALNISVPGGNSYPQQSAATVLIPTVSGTPAYTLAKPGTPLNGPLTTLTNDNL